VRLTQAGTTYREYARRALNVLEEGQSVLSELDEMLRGKLSVGVVQTVNSYLTPKIVAGFVADFPNVSLHMEELSANEIEEGVSNGTLDLGVSFEPSTGSDLLCEKLFEEELVLLVHSGHRLATRKRIKIVDLGEERFCLLNKAFCTRRLIEQCFRQAETRCQIAAELNSVAGLIAVTEAGGPPTILPRLGLEESTAKIVRLEQPTPTRSICLLRAQGHTPLRAREMFVERLLKSIK
jgi:LysR family cyn operon transcriptional activator